MLFSSPQFKNKKTPIALTLIGSAYECHRRFIADTLSHTRVYKKNREKPEVGQVQEAAKLRLRVTIRKNRGARRAEKPVGKKDLKGETDI